LNAVEIEEAVSELAAAPFDAAEFPFAFLTAFGNKATTVNRLRTPSLNKSDVEGGVLQARNIHLAVCSEGRVREKIAALRESPKTAANKAKFILATDGVTLSSETRYYLPVDLTERGTIISNLAFGIFDAPLWNLSLVASRIHLVWIATVCGKLETRYRYSNTLGWNTFPVPSLTEKNKADLTRCAQDILLAREANFPATIADLYDPEDMPDDLRAAHERNDETLERIYIGRRFRNDTERLEKLFDLYTKMTAKKAPKKPAKRGVA
jgi:hypothetical protein